MTSQLQPLRDLDWLKDAWVKFQATYHLPLKEIETDWAIILSHWNAVQPNLQNILQKVLPLADKIVRAMRDGYINDGAIYGDTTEGFAQWLTDLQVIYQGGEEAEELRRKHEELRMRRRSKES